MQKRLLQTVALALFLTTASGAYALDVSYHFEARVLKAKSGCEMELLRRKKTEHVTIYGIKCSDKDGIKNRALAMAAALEGTSVNVQVRDMQRDGVKAVTLTTQDGADIGNRLLRAGYATALEHNDENSPFLKLEDTARREKKGVWAPKPEAAKAPAKKSPSLGDRLLNAAAAVGEKIRSFFSGFTAKTTKEK